MFCDQCGKQLNQNSKFCPFCGNPAINTHADSPNAVKAQPADSTYSKPLQQGFQDVEIGKNNQSGSRMTTAAKVVGVIFFVLILIIGIFNFFADLYGAFLYDEEIGAALESSKRFFKSIIFVDAALVYSSIEGFVKIGKDKSYMKTSIETGACSILSITLMFYFRFYNEPIDFADYIAVLIFSIVLFIVAITQTNSEDAG